MSCSGLKDIKMIAGRLPDPRSGADVWAAAMLFLPHHANAVYGPAQVYQYSL